MRYQYEPSKILELLSPEPTKYVSGPNVDTIPLNVSIIVPLPKYDSSEDIAHVIVSDRRFLQQEEKIMVLKLGDSMFVIE